MRGKQIARILSDRAPTDRTDHGFELWRELVWDFANAAGRGRAEAS